MEKNQNGLNPLGKKTRKGKQIYIYIYILIYAILVYIGGQSPLIPSQPQFPD